MVKDDSNVTYNSSDSNKGKVKRMAVSLKEAPIFNGEAAKKIIRQLDNPPDKSQIFRKLESMPQIIKRK